MYFPVSKAEGRQTVVIIEKVLSLFLFVEFEIICDSVGWMRVENAWIQTAGCAFRRADEEILGDFGAEFSKTKALGAGVRIFNGTVRAEREFPLKILFLACIQGFSVLLYSAERRSKSPHPLSEYDFCLLCIKVFSHLFQSHAADKFKFQNVQFAGSIGCRNHKGRYLCGRVEQRGKKESEIPNAGAGVSVCPELFPAACG